VIAGVGVDRPGARFGWAFCLVAGFGDAATGLLLALRPALPLALLGLPAPPAGAGIYLRWIGVFVAAVGAAYLYPWLVPGRGERRGRLRAALELTAGARLAVAGFLGAAVLGAALGEGWLLVGFYDAVVGLAQLAFLTLGVFDDAP
jgi:hypothetical protein